MRCPICGELSLADITNHICSRCVVIYLYCPACLIVDDVLTEVWKEGINHEEEPEER